MLWKTKRSGLSSLAVTLVLVLTCCEAAAHAPLVADEASQQTAAELRKRANTLAIKGDFDAALSAYKESLELDQTCGTSANLGALELRLSHYRDAAEHLSYAIRACESDDLKKTLVEKLAQASAHVGAITINVGEGNATVTLDGRVVDRFDLEAIYVDPGGHVVRATSKGSAVNQTSVTVRAGETIKITLDFPPLPPSPSLLTPRVPTTLAVTHSEVPPHDKSLWLLIGGAGLASAGGALGVGFTLAANDKFSQGITARDALVAKSGASACGSPLPQNAAACANLRGVWQDHATFSDAAMWSLISGGAFAAGTITYAIWPASSEPQSGTTARVIPLLTPDGGSVLVQTRF
jgi:hypothetical protein